MQAEALQILLACVPKYIIFTDSLNSFFILDLLVYNSQDHHQHLLKRQGHPWPLSCPLVQQLFLIINCIFLLQSHLLWSSVPSELLDEHHLVLLTDCSLISQVDPSPFLIFLFLISSYFQHLKRIKPVQHHISVLKNSGKKLFCSFFFLFIFLFV